LGPEKRGRYAEGCLKKQTSDWPLWLQTGRYGFRLAVMASDWPLLTGDHYSKVVKTGLTVLLTYRDQKLRLAILSQQSKRQSINQSIPLTSTKFLVLILIDTSITMKP
jgi:hypothetical protein